MFCSAVPTDGVNVNERAFAGTVSLFLIVNLNWKMFTVAKKMNCCLWVLKVIQNKLLTENKIIVQVKRQKCDLESENGH